MHLGQSKDAMKGLAAFQANDNIDAVISDVLSNANMFTTGVGGSLLSGIPGTGARDLQENLKTIQADAAFSSLQQMRDNSKTGGALGTVSEKELGLLSAARSALSQSQSEEQFKQNLIRYQKVRRQAINNTAAAYKSDYGVEAPWVNKNPIEPKQDGQIMVDANGNRAMVFPDGSYEEL